MNSYKENQMIKWLNFREGYGDNYATYIDNSMPYSFHKPKKRPTNKDLHLKSRRFLYFKKLKEKGICELCGKVTNNLVIDHCHTSRKIRGALCQNCNHGLGKFMDSTEILEKAIKYLKTAKENEKDAVDYFSLQNTPRKPLEDH